MKRKRTKEEIENRAAIADDKKRPIAERRAAMDIVTDDMMNPIVTTDFNPNTFDPMEGSKNFDLVKRSRKTPNRRLPNTHGLLPKDIRDGQMVGMYESKQDLYLLIAWLTERVTDLEDKVNTPNGG